MRGGSHIPLIKTSWANIVPTLLKMSGDDTEVPVDFSEETSYKALLFVGKQLRPAGIGSKAAAAFTLYQVSMYFLFTLFIDPLYTLVAGRY